MFSFSFRTRSLPLRSASLWAFFFLLFCLGLTHFKSKELDEFTSDKIKLLSDVYHEKFVNAFTANFYFFFDEKFVPEVKAQMKDFPNLSQVRYADLEGKILYDSHQPGQKTDATESLSKSTLESLTSEQRYGVSVSGNFGFSIDVVTRPGMFVVVYTFDAKNIFIKVGVVFFLGLLVFFLIWLGLKKLPLEELSKNALTALRAGWSVRTKFLLTIVMVNLITGLTIYLTVSEFLLREQSRRIEKDAVLFSQFSTEKIISDFSNYFYFYYQDKFIPEIKSIVSTNENLVSIQIISKRTKQLLFDSEKLSAGPSPTQASEEKLVELDSELESVLRTRGFSVEHLQRDGRDLLGVTTTYFSESKEPLFFVRFTYSFHTLEQSIASIRNKILVNLTPSLIIAILFAAIFAQLLITPIKRLVAALHHVSEGDYEVSLDIERSDEIGTLVTAFNGMTMELRKKAELRKYLSDSTYRQLMELPESAKELNIGGRKVHATVLFADIRDFVSHCENLEAEEVTNMLNEYFTEMVDVVYKFGGEVDKFIGDALLAVFYVTNENKFIKNVTESEGTTASGTALNAIYCALEMKQKLSEFNQRRLEKNKNTIEIGIGITHGELISGPIGSKDRRDFTVIGDVVNLASRIEKISKEGHGSKIVFSHQVELLVRGLLDYDKLSTEKIRGKSEEISVFELIQIRDLQEILKNITVPTQDAGDLRIRSIYLLGQTRNPLAIPHLLALLKEKENEVRHAAINALSHLAAINDTKVIENLFKAISSEEDEKNIASLISGLGRICRTDKIFELAPFLDSNNERIVANAIEAIGQTKTDRAKDLILPQLSSRNNRIKANAALTLFATGSSSVIEMLKPMLLHSDPLMRSSAAYAIGELARLVEKQQIIDEWKSKGNQLKFFLAELQESVPMLVTLLRDVDPMVKRQVLVALGKIKDKNSVLPIINSMDWERDSTEIVREAAQALRSIGAHRLVREFFSQIA